MDETFTSADMEAEYHLGREQGLREAEAVLREEASSLWSKRKDGRAADVRCLADEVEVLANKAEKEYRQKLETAREEKEEER